MVHAENASAREHKARRKQPGTGVQAFSCVLGTHLCMRLAHLCMRLAHQSANVPSAHLECHVGAIVEHVVLLERAVTGGLDGQLAVNSLRAHRPAMQRPSTRSSSSMPRYLHGAHEGTMPSPFDIVQMDCTSAHDASDSRIRLEPQLLQGTR